jgi:hypothetical protein
MSQKRRKARGARVEWMKCDCPRPGAFGLFLRCPTCGFLFRGDPPLTRPKRGGTIDLDAPLVNSME